MTHPVYRIPQRTRKYPPLASTWDPRVVIIAGRNRHWKHLIARLGPVERRQQAEQVAARIGSTANAVEVTWLRGLHADLQSAYTLRGEAENLYHHAIDLYNRQIVGERFLLKAYRRWSRRDNAVRLLLRKYREQ